MAGDKDMEMTPSEKMTGTAEYQTRRRAIHKISKLDIGLSQEGTDDTQPSQTTTIKSSQDHKRKASEVSPVRPMKQFKRRTAYKDQHNAVDNLFQTTTTEEDAGDDNPTSVGQLLSPPADSNVNDEVESEDLGKENRKLVKKLEKKRDHIKELKQENKELKKKQEKLEGQVVDLKAAVNNYDVRCKDLEDKLEALEALNERQKEWIQAHRGPHGLNEDEDVFADLNDQQYSENEDDRQYGADLNREEEDKEEEEGHFFYEYAR